MAVSLITRTQALLGTKISKLSATMQAAYENNNLEFADAIYYKRFSIPLGASGLQDILLNDDSQKDGYCNISKQKINQGCAFMIDRVTVRLATAATSANATVADVTYGTVAALTGNSVLQNAELEIDVNQVKINQSTLISYNQETINANSDKDGLNFSAPKLVTDEQLLQFRLHLPQGSTIGSTNNYFIEVALHGAEVRVTK